MACFGAVWPRLFVAAQLPKNGLKVACGGVSAADCRLVCGRIGERLGECPLNAV